MEDERYLLKKYLSYYNEDQDELNGPITNSAQRILELFDNPEKLKEAREEARKMKERIRGFSSEVDVNRGEYFSDNKYGGFSSDDYNKGYDIKPDIDLNKKLGLNNTSYDHNKKVEQKVEVKPPVKQEADIDLLGDDGPVQKNNTNSTTEVKKPRKFLPPPPKKDKLGEPRFATETGKQEGLNDDFIGLDLGSQKTTFGSNPLTDNPSVTNNQKDSEELDFNIIGSTSKQHESAKKGEDLDMLDFSVPVTQPTNANKTTKDSDFLDLTDLSDSKPANTDNYFNVMTGKTSKLGKPPKKADNNYDFL